MPSSIMRSATATVRCFAQRLKERGIPFMIYSGYNTVEGPCKDALHISKPAADGALVAAMEGLIRGDAKLPTAISPLLVEQRQIGDEYRVVERAIQELHNLMAPRNVDPTDRAEMEADVIARTAELMRLGQRMLELDASVTVASLRPPLRMLRAATVRERRGLSRPSARLSGAARFLPAPPRRCASWHCWPCCGREAARRAWPGLIACRGSRRVE